jgi:hypothetical protein
MSFAPARAIALLLVVASSGCASDGDPPVEPGVELGFRVGGEFQAIAEGSSLPVIIAPQGGFWTMPSLRVRGFEPSVVVRCAIHDTADDLSLTEVEAERSLESEDGGWREQLFPLNLVAVSTLEDYEAIDGDTATIEISVSDSNASSSFEAEVVLDSVGL